VGRGIEMIFLLLGNGEEKVRETKLSMLRILSAMDVGVVAVKRIKTMIDYAWFICQ